MIWSVFIVAGFLWLLWRLTQFYVVRDEQAATERRARDLEQQLWWIAQEMRNAADAIGPAPDLAERALRHWADRAEKCEVEPWGGL